MAERHARTVQRMNGQFDDRKAYDILMVIALDIGRNDEPARTSYRGIAERAGCHYNTVGGKVKKLVDDGYIEIVNRGKYQCYRLLFDCDNIVTMTVTENERLSQFDERLSQRLLQLEERLSQLEAMIVTTPVETSVTKDSEDKNSIVKYSEGEEAAPPSFVTIADKRTQAIIEVCGLDASVRDHLLDAENASVLLKNYSAGHIYDRYKPDLFPNGHWYWYRDDWRGRNGDMPTPRQLIETINKRLVRQQSQPAQRKQSTAIQEAAEYAVLRQQWMSDDETNND